ncbi:metal ABC transporter permease [Blochmannia endosymbiont of Colobopsis nipponica]|uniref:metal ABC transporter permease n=1 Tax=Blochmannia endosymbiont of Colobopsis nipponica TaxID=2681987 RepID=UPI00177F6C8E|nr:metal ABC transporter permease [Blochmannia endosymbiont of Colobopsis nipponica]QOI10808.1 metal ABC transporter permease [Blochmannia endosymbiont of Colobopsis nipponica]
MLVHLLLDPFLYHGFMCRAMVVCFALSLSTALIGSFLLLRRMSLIGDALSHAILPGVVIGYLFNSTSLMAMSLGGISFGLLVAIISVWVSSKSSLKEDASFSGLYSGSLAFGVLLMFFNENHIDLLHILFGSVMSIDSYSIKYIGVVVSFTLIIFSLFYRALIIEAFDADFLMDKTTVWYPQLIQVLFLGLVVLNLVASFQVIGTLMAIGLMMLPVLSARCWTTSLSKMLLFSVCISCLCSYCGLMLSFYMSLPIGPVIVLLANIVFFLSVFFN